MPKALTSSGLSVSLVKRNKKLNQKQAEESQPVFVTEQSRYLIANRLQICHLGIDVRLPRTRGLVRADVG